MQVSNPCSSTSRESSGSCWTQQETRRADHLWLAVELGATRNRPVCEARASGSSQARPRGYDGASRSCNDSDRSGLRLVEVEEPAAGEQRRAARSAGAGGFVPSNGGHSRTGCERVQPFGRRRHSRAYDCHFVRVRRAARRHERLARRPRARRERRRRRVPVPAARARTRFRGESSSKPPSIAEHGRCGGAGHARPRPLRTRSLGDVVEELLDRRVEAVAHAGTSGTNDLCRRAARTARPGNDVGRQWPSLSERISRLPDRAARPAKRRGVSVGREDGDRFRLDRPVEQRQVGDEPGEPTADNCERPPASHFTEPASSPWVKYRWNAKNTARGIASEMKDAGAIMSMLRRTATAGEDRHGDRPACRGRTSTRREGRSTSTGTGRSQVMRSRAIRVAGSRRTKILTSDAPSMRADSKYPSGSR